MVDTLLARATAEYGTVNWSAGPADPSTSAAYWCNGAAGVATFLVRAYTRTGDPRLPPVLDGAARAMMTRKWRLGVAYCHGLAGNGDTLLETAEAAGLHRHAAWADDLGAMVVAAVHRVRGGGLGGTQPGDNATGPDSRAVVDFQVGLGGVLAFLARLDRPGPRLWLPPLYPEAVDNPPPTYGATLQAENGTERL